MSSADNALTVGEVRTFLARMGVPHEPTTHYVVSALASDGLHINGCCDGVAHSVKILSNAMSALLGAGVPTAASPSVVVARDDLSLILGAAAAGGTWTRESAPPLAAAWDRLSDAVQEPS
jgi:hypothetical protein